MIPSLEEGLPYILLEAMYLRIPVIASAVGGMKEILEDGYDSLLIPPANGDKLADCIKYLYENPELRNRLADNAFKKVTSLFLIEKLFTFYLNIYEELLIY